ncbi:microcystin-dependent protein [Chitinophaga niastensis]|uniref:Microcystin-dependent protein n=1 Tax=Chitinophaga niastensis TaxID=536980 RepID=A0A2P8H9I9_CHINA|nr:tail fiber protein [Chitinophaga niastensis]PSL42897.1 microcystin-dependent protein [Chitinophaga niastensis]
MSADEAFVGEIIMVPFNFAPINFTECNGQLLPISQNTALFSLLGTTYGGDGRANFALPNMAGMVPIGTGQGPGMSQRDLGMTGGVETVTLSVNEMPSHTHIIKTRQLSLPAGDVSNTINPVGNYPGNGAALLYDTVAGAGTMPINTAIQAMPSASPVPVNNMQPYLTILFLISLKGTFPART